MHIYCIIHVGFFFFSFVRLKDFEGHFSVQIWIPSGCIDNDFTHETVNTVENLI